ncbi:hypothetical protein LTR85_010566 [Meristemomyces frigidus]|nr:hypothetical protein LTR85_010566 [Meristemomyces frigidus]
MDAPATSAGPSNSSPVQQRSPSIHLDSVSQRTSSRNALNRVYLDAIGSPPATPSSTRRRTKKGKEPAHTPGTRRRELLRREDNDAQRHSHGLSWSSTTRDSVLDSLLLSLDNLSSQPPPEMDNAQDDEFDKDKYRMPTIPQLANFPASRPSQRPRGHTYSSSLSSGYDGYGTVVADSPSSKYSSSTKGRRSNSSSNFGITNSINGRVHPAKRMHSNRTSSDTQRRASNGVHVKNASSDLDSVDYGYGAVLETNRLNWGGRRSFSMDQIYTQPSTVSSVLDRGRPVPSVHSKFEGDGSLHAAPEPGIPAGPRTKQNPTATGPVYVDQAPARQTNLRKINTQSDLRMSSKPGPPIPQYIQDQASDFVRANSMRGTPSMPLPHERGAPASSPGFKTSRKDAPSPHRERPGFFKRVFGSSSRTPSGVSERSDQPDTLGSIDKAVPPLRSKSQASNDTTTQARQPSRDHLPTSYPPPALNKKPSSFFRRRKKSSSDGVPPPLPLNAAGNLNLHVRAAEPSPSVSSLRKVMDPYLAKDAAAMPKRRMDESSRPRTKESTTDNSDDLDMFHSGYTPPPDASLGRRDPMRRSGSSKAKGSTEREESPRMKLKVKKRKPDAVEPSSQQSQQSQQHLGEGSFLHDDSRKTSTATIGEHFTSASDQPRVSPLTEMPPDASSNKENERPISRASTGDRIIAAKGTSPIEPSTEMRSFSAGTNVSVMPSDDGFVVMHRPSGEAFIRPDSKKSDRLFLQPTEAEEKREESNEGLSSVEDSRNSSMSVSLKTPAVQTGDSSATQSPGIPSVYHSATSLPLPSVQIDGKELPRKSTDTATPRALPPSPLADVGAEYNERARRIYEGDEEDVDKAEAASWLGENNTLSTRTLHAYMQLFDFAALNILSALRTLANKLLLKGETQQFDRIITAMSARWCECNPNHGFKAQDVVHTICYSLILLNTDLHMADIGEKMSKSAYVKNTLPTIRRVVADAAPNAFDDTIKPSANTSRLPLPWTESSASPTSPTFPASDTLSERLSFEAQRPNANKRLSIRPGMFRNESDGWTPDSAGGNASNTLVSQSWSGPMRGWEFEIETMLKSFYSSIKSDPLPLLGATTAEIPSYDRTLSVANLGGLKRSGSVISKAPSDNMSYRSKPGFRTMTLNWQSRNNRSRPKLYPASTVASSRTSFDDGNSVWSPANSSTWSKNSFARTLTSASVNSLGYHLSPVVSDYKHSIGFANALSQAIIREESAGAGAGDAESISVPAGLLEDEALALEGAPWAKEGLVKHKHHLETPDRKAKERSWNDCFAVISKGKLTLFAFNTSSKSHSMGRKALQKHNGGRAASVTATRVGGGDWMENAEELDVFVLRQTIASTLPKPGYSKTRPHVWALSLPSGAVHLFQVGTPEIAREFMTSANYWSARLSKEPLSGGVSNIEYGWSDQVVNPALVERSESFHSPPPALQNTRGHMHSSSGSANMARPSFQSSLRGSFDTGFGSAKARTMGDKAQIADWHPPSQSMMASQLMEVDQLKALTAYVSNVESELETHNELKHAIDLAYSPRHANHNRSMANWQRKSDYLLREIVKFRTYMESLSAAQVSKASFYARKAEQEATKGAVSPVDSGRFKEDRDITPRAPTSQTPG